MRCGYGFPDIYILESGLLLDKQTIVGTGVVKAVSAALTKSDRGQVARHCLPCFRQEPRSRRLALTASAGQHFLPALR